jgi:hypothetical protein
MRQFYAYKKIDEKSVPADIGSAGGVFEGSKQ